jgi:hypothetical protein
MTQYKLIFFVPIAAKEIVKEAVFTTGAGELGNYARCSFETQGIGQFLPLIGASPALGQPLTLTKVEEVKVEILCHENNIQAALDALKASHPYEEPAFEVVKLENYKFSAVS